MRTTPRPLRRRAGAGLALLLTAGPLAAAQTADTERLWLSGTGRAQTVDWSFRCDEHPRCRSWTTIPVPSQWELEGMGHYNYGHDRAPARDVGHYRFDFTPPRHWRGWAVDLVFDGVMTDALVRLNGVVVGEHRGGFYRFRLAVEGVLEPGAENRLEVTVHEHSAEASVNRAEREADYWIFGGIYRPVFLEARPPESIASVAIDARHDGRLRAVVRLAGLTGPATLEAEIRDADGRPVSGVELRAEPRPRARDARSETAVLLEHAVSGVRPWSAEDPQLYRLELRLLRDGRLLHGHGERFGFRTVELRPGAGLFVNGRRVLLKGVNRHAFWPDSGRTLDRTIDRRDVELMRSMNLNAVRASHYPPDPSFLEACDELGLYVLDELAGWHDAYSTVTGRRLAREMVERDRNHPSILAWVNGNEGGSNPELDPVIRRHDPQHRPVLHADALRSGVLTSHYPSWSELDALLAERSGLLDSLRPAPPLVLPTESLHGLYDGGSAAGLEPFWTLVRSSPRALGLFLWAFLDEAVVRVDRNGELDTDGNHAPDGIVGPYREPTANAEAVRALFAPVALRDGARGAGFGGPLEVENRFAITDLARCRFSVRWIALPAPTDAVARWRVLGEVELPGPSVPPGESGTLRLPPAPPDAEALELAAHGPDGGLLRRWVLERESRSERVRRWLRRDDGASRDAPRGLASDEQTLTLEIPAGRLRFALARGSLHVEPASGVSFGLAPVLGEGGRFTTRHRRDGTDSVVEMRSAGPLRRLEWRVDSATGWLRLAFEHAPPVEGEAAGPAFTLTGAVEGMEWLGGGPGRVWGNRLAGASLGLWRKAHGAPRPPIGSALEPLLPGYYADVDWARLATERGTITVVFESEGLFLRVLRPSFPDDARFARAPIPPGDLAFEASAPAIGSKFHAAAELAPPPASAGAPASLEGVVWLRLEPAGEEPRP